MTTGITTSLDITNTQSQEVSTAKTNTLTQTVTMQAAAGQTCKLDVSTPRFPFLIQRVLNILCLLSSTQLLVLLMEPEASGLLPLDGCGSPTKTRLVT